MIHLTASRLKQMLILEKVDITEDWYKWDTNVYWHKVYWNFKSTYANLMPLWHLMPKSINEFCHKVNIEF